ncbi:sigma-54 dependent transcriptional regulator [Marinospirillum sp. MEB164]|uniref:Sigma-54 dependent transcriptional regulator n=1 Tax=Marinospirillum alkalitolerans TaxID=3123374 RepID=A0ABW8PZI9_9GAMM
MTGRILIVEDEGIIRSALRRLLERNGFEVTEAGSVPEAQQHLDSAEFNLIISDLRLPGEAGTELLSQSIPVLIMTSYASLRSAVDAMKLGAVDYIAKPFDHDEMLSAVRHLLAQVTPSQPSAAEPAPLASTQGIPGMLGDSPIMQAIYTQIKKIAPFDTRVLILGESGTGKELVAKALHQLSQRHKGPMISVNCAAIPETLIESELFGHEKGAFTGANTTRQGLIEAADGGTLFLDEIGELPLDAQARLLRVLQEGEIRRLGAVESRQVDVRLIAATHRDIKLLVDQGKFRLDLYYRLNVIELELPCLAERGEDILLLAEHLLEQTAHRLSKPLPRFSKAARQALLDYNWPGNVRELENRVERALILAEDAHLLHPQDLQLVSRKASYARPEAQATHQSNNTANPFAESSHDEAHLPADDLSLEDYFVRFVRENEDQMSETELAKKLGISRKCLWERRQRLGIPRRKTSVTR